MITRFFLAYAFLFLVTSPLVATSWTPTAFISGTMSAAAVATCYNAASDQVIAVWADFNNDKCRYAFYQNGSWSSVGSFETNGVGGTENVVLCYDPVHQLTMAVWSGGDNLPVYSVYSQTDDVWSWSTPTVLGSPAATIKTWDLHCCYDSKNSRIFVTFTRYDGGAPHYPYYAVYDGTSWSGPTQIATTTSDYSTSPSCCYNPSTDELLATWCSPAAPGTPVYARIPNGSTSLVATHNMFSDGSYIAYSALPLYNTTDNTMMVLLVYGNRSVDYVFYPDFGTDPTPIAPMYDASFFVSGIYDTVHNQFVTTWSSFQSPPYMASYSANSGWSSPLSISTTSSTYDGAPSISYISSLDAYITAWIDFPSQQIAYSLLYPSSIASNPFTTALIAKYGGPI